SGSIVAKRLAPSPAPTKDRAVEAASAASFQPLNAQISAGARRRSGRYSQRSGCINSPYRMGCWDRRRRGGLGARTAGARAAKAKQGLRAPSIILGAAGAWWPIPSSKRAGRGSPPLGRFDSFAASLRLLIGIERGSLPADAGRCTIPMVAGESSDAEGCRGGAWADGYQFAEGRAGASARRALLPHVRADPAARRHRTLGAGGGGYAGRLAVAGARVCGDRRLPGGDVLA